MQDQRKEVFLTLQGDELLLTKLATNTPFWNKEIEAENRYSIIPADKIWDGIKTPFVTVQITNDNLIGTKLSDAFAYIRCYNDGDKTFVEIDEVLSRVKALLHSHRFDYAENAVSIDTIYETTGPETQDEAYGLNYRESRYRILYL